MSDDAALLADDSVPTAVPAKPARRARKPVSKTRRRSARSSTQARTAASTRRSGPRPRARRKKPPAKTRRPSPPHPSDAFTETSVEDALAQPAPPAEEEGADGAADDAPMVDEGEREEEEEEERAPPMPVVRSWHAPIGAWMDRENELARSYMDAILRETTKWFAKRYAPFLGILREVVGKMYEDEDAALRKPTATDEALFRKSGLTAEQKIMYYAFRNTIDQIVTHLDDRVYDATHKDQLSKTLREYDEARRNLAQKRYDLRKEELQRKGEAKTDPRLQDSIAEAQAAVAHAEAEYNRMLASAQAAVLQGSAPEASLAEDLVVKIEPDDPLGARIDPRLADVVIGARIATRFSRLGNALRMTPAGHLPTTALRKTCMQCAAPIGARPTAEELAARRRQAEANTIEYISDQVSAFVRGMSVPRPDPRVPAELWAGVRAPVRAHIEQALDRLRGLVRDTAQNEEDMIQLGDIARFTSVRILFTELAATALKLSGFEYAARAQSGRYHAARNKDDYLKREGEIMRELRRYMWSQSSRSFLRGARGRAFPMAQASDPWQKGPPATAQRPPSPPPPTIRPQGRPQQEFSSRHMLGFVTLARSTGKVGLDW